MSFSVALDDMTHVRFGYAKPVNGCNNIASAEGRQRHSFPQKMS
jgi:hypothetical protein